MLLFVAAFAGTRGLDRANASNFIAIIDSDQDFAEKFRVQRRSFALDLLAPLDDLLRKLERNLEVAADERYSRELGVLQSIPGVGPIISMTVLAVHESMRCGCPSTRAISNRRSALRAVPVSVIGPRSSGEGRGRVNRNVSWCLPLCLLAVAAAHGQAPTKVTSLPRPRDWGTAAQLPADAPAVLLPPEGAPPLVPVGSIPAGPPVVAIDPNAPFYRRFRAELLELAILFPNVSQTLGADVDVGGLFNSDVRLPTASLGFTAPVILNLQYDAYRYGKLNLGYRGIFAEGSEALLTLDPNGPAALRSRLDMHIIDLTFASSGFGPLWNLLWFVNEDPRKPDVGLRWDLGARFATFFFDSTAIGPTVERHISSSFIGGGPHVALKLHKLLGDSGVSLFGRADLGMNMGTVRQKFSELARDAGGNPLGFGFTERDSTRAVPTLIADIGLGGEPPFTRRGQWEFAYQYEQWFGIADAGPSRGDLVNHGFVLRWFCQY